MPDLLTCSYCGAQLSHVPSNGLCPACLQTLAPDDAGATTTRTGVPGATNESKRIGPYRILETLGEGGMGVVYLAEQEAPVRRRVAIKLIKLGMDTRQVVARFEAERQALALMNHPNIAAVFDAGATVEGRPFFVMEYVQGVPITEYCDRHQLSNRERLALFLPICGAIQHAHQKGIIHRDLKPSNVLVALHDGQPVPKVIDFGVAKATHQRLTEKTLFTEHGVLVGTPEYMSPEQAEMTVLDVDATTDIYSLGVLLYELLTGALPFEPARLRKAGYAEIQRIIREEEPARPSTRVSSLGATASDVVRRRRTDLAALMRQLRGDLDWIILRAMAKDRTRRYASASEFAADLSRHLHDEPVVARPISTAYRVRKFVRRHRAGVAATVGVALALVTGLVVATVMYFRAETARHNSDYQAYVATVAAADADLKAGQPGEARRRLLASSPEFRDNWEWRYLFARTDASIAMLPALEDEPSSMSSMIYGCRSSLAVSPDGRRVFLAGGHLVQSWEVEGASAATTVYATDRSILAIDPRGDLIATIPNARNAEGIEIVEVGTKAVIAKLPADDFLGVKFDASGDRVATNAKGGITVWNTRSGTPVASTPRLFRRGILGRADVTLAADGSLLALTDSSIWPVGSPRRVAVASSPAQGFSSCQAFSPDATHLVTITRNGLQEWDAATGAPTRLLGTVFFSEALAFSPEGHFLASGEGGNVRLWDMISGRIEANLAAATEQGRVKALAFSPDSRRLFAAFEGVRGEHPHIRVWDMARVHLAMGFPAAFRSHAFFTDSAPLDPKVAAALELPRLPAGFRPDPRLVKASAVSAEGRHVALAVPGHVGLWNLDSRSLERQLRLETRTNCHADCEYGEVKELALSRDARRLIAGTTDGGAFWSGLDDQPPVRLAHYDVSAVAISPDGALAAAGRSKGGASVWNLTTGRELMTVSAADPVESVSFDATSRQLLIWISEEHATRGLLQVWDLTTGHQVWQTTRLGLAAVAASPDGRVAVGWSGPDASIQLLDATTGAPAISIPLGTSGVGSLAFNADGRRLAGATSQTVRIWDVKTGAELLKLWDPSDESVSQGFVGIQSVSFSLDGERLLALARNSLRVFDAASAYYPGAAELVQRLQEELVFSEDVLARLRSIAGLHPDLRRAAITLAQALGDSASALNRESQKITHLPNQPPDRYRHARRMAELAVRMKPRDGASLLSLGMAQYRNGDYAAALEILQRPVDVLRPPSIYVKPAFVAMAQARLGHADAARTELKGLRGILSPFENHSNDNGLDVWAIQKEAEDLVAKSAGR